MPDDTTPTALTVTPPEAPQAGLIRDYGIVNMEWRKDYLRWFINELIEISLQQQLAKQQGKSFEGPHTIQEVIRQPGPHAMTPDYRTVRRWLKEEWAKEIAGEISEQVELVMGLEIDMRWPRIVRHQMDVAETAPGRDSTLAATFIERQRKGRGIDPSNAIGRRIADILGSGRFDGELRVTEKTAQLKITSVPAAYEIIDGDPAV